MSTQTERTRRFVIELPPELVRGLRRKAESMTHVFGSPSRPCKPSDLVRLAVERMLLAR